MREIGVLVALIAGLLGVPTAAVADDVIKVRVSVKVIRSADGRLPDGVIPDRLAAFIEGDLNQPPPAWWRGYRFLLVDPITQIGGGDPSGPSRWFDENFFLLTVDRIKEFLEVASVTDPAAYAWNPNAINIYLNNATGNDGIGGLAPCIATEPPFACAILLGGKSAETTGTYLHEIGHVFGLRHTYGACAACDPMRTGPCHTVPGDDGLADTLPDLRCFRTPNDIARFNFGSDAASLPRQDLEHVLGLFENLMSHYIGAPKLRLTELQLDLWADFASGHGLPAEAPQNDVVDGRTLFVAADAVASGRGSSGAPFEINQAVAAANPQGGDILLFRPGAYPGARAFDRAVTLRVTRAGPAVLGGPSPPPPPLRCPAHLRCCPRAQPDGTCTGQCWPPNMHCP